MDGMQKARRELEMLAPDLRVQLQVHGDGSRACGLFYKWQLKLIHTFKI